MNTEDNFTIYEGNIPFVNSKYTRLIITDTTNSENQSDCYYRYIKN